MITNQRVDHGAEVGRSSRNEPAPDPPDGKHACMVIYVQERDLIKLLAKYEDNLAIKYKKNIKNTIHARIVDCKRYP
jgi:hypothetical protein